MKVGVDCVVDQELRLRQPSAVRQLPTVTRARARASPSLSLVPSHFLSITQAALASPQSFNPAQQVQSGDVDELD